MAQNHRQLHSSYCNVNSISRHILTVKTWYIPCSQSALFSFLFTEFYLHYFKNISSSDDTFQYLNAFIIHFAPENSIYLSLSSDKDRQNVNNNKENWNK